VLIVSEETGTISTALDGKLNSNYSYQSLKKFLERELLVSDEEISRRKQLKNILHISQKDRKNVSKKDAEEK
jgi:hypothetical protein